MPNQFFAEQGPFGVAEDIEEIFATDYWLFEQYIGDQLWAWGQNSQGQLGNNDIISRSTPRQEFTSSTNWKQVSTSPLRTSAIKMDGTLWSWGRYVGDNTTASRSTPRQEFTSSTNWKQVACGNQHTVALKTDGTLWSWGRNDYGNLGVNNTTAIYTPVQEITSSTNWSYVSAGNYATAAIKTDGTLWCWGRNYFGGIGDNTNGAFGGTNSRSTPRQEITSSTNWKQVVRSGSNTDVTAAIKTDGTLWVWGFSGMMPDSAGKSTPFQIGTANNWKQISISGYNFGAIKYDGTLWVWGYGTNGQLGTNDTTQRPTPVPVFGGATNWKQVSCGEYNGQDTTYAAIKTDGTLWTWGQNAVGSLGVNDNSVRSTPVQEFTSSTNWKQVSAGYSCGAVKTGIDIATGTLT